MTGRFMVLAALVCGLLRPPAAPGEIRYTIVEARQAGPTVAALGLDCDSNGAVRFALQQIARMPIKHGRLLVAAERVRTAARRAFDATADWPQTAPTTRVFLQSHRPEFVLVLAEDYDCYASVPAALGHTISVWTGDAQLVHIAQRIAADLNAGVDNDAQRWRLLNMRTTPHPRLAYWPEWVMGHALPVIVTTSRKDTGRDRWVAFRTRQLRLAAARWLRELGMLGEGIECYPLVDESSRRRPTVAIYQGPGAASGAGDPLWLLQSLAHLPCAGCLVCPADIADGALAQFNVLIVGPGNAREQSKALGARGRRAIREYIGAGGGYVGIGAGALLACAGDDARLGLIDAPVLGESGRGVVPLAVTSAGTSPLGLSGVHPAELSGAPVFDADRVAPPCAVWARYADDPPRSTSRAPRLEHAAAIVAAEVGHGRVVVFGPDCERYPGPQQAFWNALAWAAGAEPGLFEKAAAIHVTPATVTSPHEHGEDIFGGAATSGWRLLVRDGPNSHHYVAIGGGSGASTPERPTQSRETAAGPSSRGGQRVARIRSRLLAPAGPAAGLVAAHRGHHLRDPENSLAAIEAAARAGAHLVTIDVRRTADGSYVLMHDATIERTTTGRGHVSDLTLAELKRVRLVHALRPTRQRIPTLPEALQAARGLVMLEVNLRSGDLAELIERVRRAGGLDLCVFAAGWSGLGAAQRDWIARQRDLIFMPIVDSEAELLEAQEVTQTRLFKIRVRAAAWKATDGARWKKLRRSGGRLWISTLGDGPGAVGLGDRHGIDDPASVYCRLVHLGFDVVETDLPELAVRALRDCMAQPRFLDLQAPGARP